MIFHEEPMANYLLFKQIVCLLLFFETVVLWPKFYCYFGPLIFPKSLFTTPFRIVAFNLILLTSLAFVFLSYYAVLASFIVFVCMRYLYVTQAANRISTFGAVGYICYLTSAYIFFFEAAFVLDSSHQLATFLCSVFAIEVGIIMFSAGIYKYILGYLNDTGFEFALVNPSWSKFFFLFKKLSPSSWVFKANNYVACLAELLTGLFFFIPQTRMLGAYLLLIMFAYVFLTVRVNLLALLMMSIALLYIKPIAFHFPVIDAPTFSLATPQPIIMFIKIVFVVYLAVYISLLFWSLLKKSFIPLFSLPNFLEKPIQMFKSARPYFEWSVFAPAATHFFVTIEKALKSTKEVRCTLYDGFSKHYREIFENPQLFFRFIHHHESSILLQIFAPFDTSQEEDRQQAVDLFVKKMASYGKTLLRESELEDTAVVFTIMYVAKTPDDFVYTPYQRFFVDVKAGTILMFQSYTPEGIVYTQGD